MSRRRLILAACVAAVALGAAWWWFADGLTAEEQRLVGVWRTPQDTPGCLIALEFSANRESRRTLFYTKGGVSFTGHWSLRDGFLVIDYERSALRRAVRPVRSLAAYFGWAEAEPQSMRVEATTDTLAFVSDDGKRWVFDRITDR